MKTKIENLSPAEKTALKISLIKDIIPYMEEGYRGTALAYSAISHLEGDLYPEGEEDLIYFVECIHLNVNQFLYHEKKSKAERWVYCNPYYPLLLILNDALFDAIIEISLIKEDEWLHETLPVAQPQEDYMEVIKNRMGTGVYSIEVEPQPYPWKPIKYEEILVSSDGEEWFPAIFVREVFFKGESLIIIISENWLEDRKSGKTKWENDKEENCFSIASAPMMKRQNDRHRLYDLHSRLPSGKYRRIANLPDDAVMLPYHGLNYSEGRLSIVIPGQTVYSPRDNRGPYYVAHIPESDSRYILYSNSSKNFWAAEEIEQISGDLEYFNLEPLSLPLQLPVRNKFGNN